MRCSTFCMMAFGVTLTTLSAGCDTSGPDDAGIEDAGEPAPFVPETLTWTAEGFDDSVEHHPEDRWGFVVADRGDGTSLLFGGSERGEFDGDLLADVWTIDANTVPATLAKRDGTGPDVRYCGCAAYDPTRGLALFVGGRGDYDETLGRPVIHTETWRYDDNNDTFTQLTSPTQPDEAYGCSLVYVPDDDRFVLFGGGTDTGERSNTVYLFNPNTDLWAPVNVQGTVPTGRYDHALAYVPGSRELLMFAGFDTALQADVWRYHLDDETWREVPLGVSLPGRRTPWLRVAPDGSEAIFGFGAAGDIAVLDEPLSDLWQLTLEDEVLTALTPEGDTPKPRGFSPAIPGGEGDVGLMLGGYDGFNPIGDGVRLVAPQGSAFR